MAPNASIPAATDPAAGRAITPRGHESAALGRLFS